MSEDCRLQLAQLGARFETQLVAENVARFLVGAEGVRLYDARPLLPIPAKPKPPPVVVKKEETQPTPKKEPPPDPRRGLAPRRHRVSRQPAV